MDYLWTFLAPFAKDKAVWLTVATWALKLANSHLHFGMDDATLTAVAGCVSAWAATHVTHLKVFGGDGNLSGS